MIALSLAPAGYNIEIVTLSLKTLDLPLEDRLLGDSGWRYDLVMVVMNLGIATTAGGRFVLF